MNEELIKRHNSLVKPGDTVYNLGDMFLGMNAQEATNLYRRLNGTHCFIRGNHDKVADQVKNLFNFYKDYYELKIDKQKIVMFHYPLRTWNGSHHSSFHAFGHCHNSLPDDPKLLAIDVGVDCHNYYPLSLDDFYSIMKKWIANGEGPIAGDRTNK